jgi:hypothetical protein
MLQSASMNTVINRDWYIPFRKSPHRLLFDSPYRLRFELGGEVHENTTAPVPRFIQALERCRAVADAVFASSEQVIAVVGSSPEPARDFYAPTKASFAALYAMGLRLSPMAEWKASLDDVDLDDDDEPPPSFLWRAFDITGSPASRDVLLWSSVTYEMPIQPAAPVIPFLADTRRGILLHVYDDRGMDVTATAAEPLLPIYRSFDRWLLDYDRERMRAAFG